MADVIVAITIIRQIVIHAMDMLIIWLLCRRLWLVDVLSALIARSLIVCNVTQPIVLYVLLAIMVTFWIQPKYVNNATIQDAQDVIQPNVQNARMNISLIVPKKTVLHA